MIFGDFLKSLGQLGDHRFRRVLGLGVVLSLALLVGVYAGFLGLVNWVAPDSVDIPFVGPVGGLHTLLSWGSALFMIGLSVFLMVPVASAFTSLFLDDVSDAVEARHYPQLTPAPRVSFLTGLVDSLNFFGLLIVVNIFALILYGFAGPFIPVVFWAVNGFLLGREYFTLVAIRRLGRAGAKAMRREYMAQIWLAGTLMAAPLSIPFLNLLIPVLGAATFTHLFHRLNHTAAQTQGRSR